MLSGGQVNEIIVEVEHVPLRVQSRPSSSEIIPEKTPVNSDSTLVSSIPDSDVTDSQIFSNRNDQKGKQLLRFATPLKESFSQTLHNSENTGLVTLHTSHENIQGETLGQKS